MPTIARTSKPTAALQTRGNHGQPSSVFDRHLYIEKGMKPLLLHPFESHSPGPRRRLATRKVEELSAHVGPGPTSIAQDDGLSGNAAGPKLVAHRPRQDLLDHLRLSCTFALCPAGRGSTSRANSAASGALPVAPSPGPSMWVPGGGHTTSASNTSPGRRPNEPAGQFPQLPQLPYHAQQLGRQLVQLYCMS